MNIQKLFYTLCFIACFMQTEAQDMVLEINTHKRGAEIAPTMYGVFFEDINYGADGGLYAELVKNRSFEFPQPLMGWNTIGGVEVRDDGPFNRCPHYVRLSYSGKRDMPTGIENTGFLGMSLHGGKEYRFSVWARVPGNVPAQLNVGLRDLDLQEESFTVCDTDINVSNSEWRKYTVMLTPSHTIKKASLTVFLKGNASVDVEHVSLFPVNTWRGHENGLREDLAQYVADLNPGVMRFPGGCIVEGATLDTKYNWKNSIGPVENRPLNETRWNYGKERTHFDYYQSYGLGFFEFFQFCEEIGAEPLPVLSCGMACQFNNDITTKGSWIAQGDSLNEFIQDAIDLIEFCNGDPEKNKWAKIRADMGHPAPFNLKYLAIGNEQWGEWYAPMLKAFMKPIRNLYPQIKIIGSSGPWPDGKEYDYLWPEMRKAGVDFVDEHFYKDEDFFLSGVSRYDKFPRKGPKVYAGEYACHGKGKKWNRFYSSLCEAAFMTGLEQNADVVKMATYAPLFAHIDGWQWRPDMIWFDNLRSVRTSSYYVQQLFSTNRGTSVLPITVKGDTDKIYASAARDAGDKDAVIVKVVNTGEKDIQVAINLKGTNGEHSMTATVLSVSEDQPFGNVNYGGDKVNSLLDCDNSLDNPVRVIPHTTESKIMCPHITVKAAAYSVSVFRIKTIN